MLAHNTAKTLFRHAVEGATVEVTGTVNGRVLSGIYTVKSSRSQSGRTGQRFLTLAQDGQADIEVGWRRDPLMAFVLKSVPKTDEGTKTVAPRATQSQTLTSLMAQLNAMQERLNVLEGRSPAAVASEPAVAAVAVENVSNASVAEASTESSDEAILNAIVSEENSSEGSNEPA